MKFLLPFLALIFTFVSAGEKKRAAKYDANQMYSVEELKEDLSFLHNKWKHRNPNLYLYISKEKLDHVFDSLAKNISSPMTDMQFYRFIGPLTSIVKDGHTSVFPNDDCEWWYGNQSWFFPFLVTCNNNKITTDLCASMDRTIPDGSEIVSINGKSTVEIIARMQPYAPRDGENSSRVSWVMNNFFTYYYCYCVESAGYFEIEYIDPQGKIHTHKQTALPVDSIWANAYRNYPERYVVGKKDSAITLRFRNDSSIAILRIRTFEKNSLRAMGVPSFKKTIHQYLSVVTSTKSPYLIIDVRDNAGGSPEYASYLISHLLDTSFIYIEKYKTVNRLHWNDSENRLRTQWYPNSGIGTFRSQKSWFRGNLIVLMDGGSTSTAGDFVACLDYYGRATFIGEESGSNRVVSGGNVFESTFELPNTKLRCRMSTIQGINKFDQVNDGHGVLPHYPVAPTPADYMSNRNPMLEKALEIIRNGAL